MMIFRQSSLAAQPQNRRVRDAEFAQNRGAILAGRLRSPRPCQPRTDSNTSGYPDGEACHHRLLSYDRASSGLERTYNAQLAGTMMRSFRRLVDIGDEPHAGRCERTNHDRSQDQKGADALGNRKALWSLNPKTGAVLAMVTSPSYDPNDIASHDIEDAGKAYDGLRPTRSTRCPTEPPVRSIHRVRRSSW